MDPLSQLGVGGVFAVFIIREVFNLLDKRKTANGSIEPDDSIKKTIYQISKQIDDLHDWHKVTDEDGVKVWYVRRSLETSLKDLSDNIRIQTEVLQKILQTQTNMENNMNKLEADLAKQADNKSVSSV